jgi:AAA15 family ATPase/GTPase
VLHFTIELGGIKEEIKLFDLGRINIICGKNNSGKTTILEAIAKAEKIGFEIESEDIESMVTSFTRQANGFSLPSPGNAIAWFRNLLSALSVNKEIWFTNRRENFIKKIREDMGANGYLTRWAKIN